MGTSRFAGFRRSGVVIAAVALALLATATAPAFATAKDDSYAQLQAIGQQLQDLKPGAPNYSSLFAQYQTLSAQLGGDDPSELLGGNTPVSGVAGGGGAAPTAPLDCVTITTSATNSTPLAIPDSPAPPVSSTLVIAGAGIYLWDLNLTTFITHTFAADLDFTLTSPAGTVVTISTDNGGGNDNVFNGTVWDDQGGTPATDAIYANNVVATPLVVEEALGAFIGEDPNGTWTITIGDDAGIDTGTLNSWTLDIVSLETAPIDDATQNYVNNTPLAIPDSPAPPVSSTIVVSGGPTFLCDGVLTTFITHTFAADLDFTLTSPAGTIVTISTDNGGGNDNVFNGTVWDDLAGTPATDAIYANNVVATPLVVEEAMSAFIGEDTNGTWTITIGDDAGIDTGTLNSWSLDFTGCACAPPEEPFNPAIPTLDTVGLVALLLALASIGVVALRRRRA